VDVLVAQLTAEEAEQLHDRRVPDPRRLPRFAATIEQDLIMARGDTRNRDVVEEPTAAKLAVLRCLAAGLAARDRRAALLSLNTVKTHTRELYRNLDVTSPADVVARPPALGLRDLSESPG
jgi:ATP/maltotriose-dependent transcriptional regulator MalT